MNAARPTREEAQASSGGGSSKAKGKQSENVEKAVKTYKKTQAHAALKGHRYLPEFADEQRGVDGCGAGCGRVAGIDLAAEVIEEGREECRLCG